MPQSSLDVQFEDYIEPGTTEQKEGGIKFFSRAERVDTIGNLDTSEEKFKQSPVYRYLNSEEVKKGDLCLCFYQVDHNGHPPLIREIREGLRIGNCHECLPNPEENKGCDYYDPAPILGKAAVERIRLNLLAKLRMQINNTR